MIRVSSRFFWFSRLGVPLGCLLALGWASADFRIVLLGAAAYSAWYGWRLSEVCIDGDELVVKGLASFRVPLANALLLDTGSSSWMRKGADYVFVLGLNPPVNGIQKVRFIPADGSTEQELQARLHAARAARSVQ